MKFSDSLIPATVAIVSSNLFVILYSLSAGQLKTTQSFLSTPIAELSFASDHPDIL